jgi:hypothetical protein
VFVQSGLVGLHLIAGFAKALDGDRTDVLQEQSFQEPSRFIADPKISRIISESPQS